MFYEIARWSGSDYSKRRDFLEYSVLRIPKDLKITISQKPRLLKPALGCRRWGTYKDYESKKRVAAP
jgi:hypothetical protein